MEKWFSAAVAVLDLSRFLNCDVLGLDCSVLTMHLGGADFVVDTEEEEVDAAEVLRRGEGG
jgi:hypothetical protein